MEWTWWMLVLILPAWFVQNCIHEGSHLLTGWLVNGLKPGGFYPYPHFSDGKFYFARCILWGFPKTFQYKAYLIAPMYAALIWAAIWAIVFLLTWSLWCLPMIATGLVDALWWWRGYFFGRPSCDGKLWRYGFKVQ